MPDIDELTIQINAESQKANDALDKLIVKLDRLTTSLASVDGSKLNGLASGVSQLGTAMQNVNAKNINAVSRLSENITKLSTVNISGLEKVASSLPSIASEFNKIGEISVDVQKFTELANGISRLGNKSATNAIANIPKLATSMKELMKELSTAPKVSQNLIDMTNSLAKLARTGASSGKAAQSLSNSFTGIYKSSGFAVSGIKKVNARLTNLIRSIAPVVGLVKLIDFGKQAMEISSDLTEVQNVVDVTFGEYSSLVDKMAETSIVDFGMSELTVKQISSRFQAMGTAIGFSQGEMADMSIELTKLTADMASFYDVEQDAVAKSLQSIFTGETEPLRKYGLDLTNATLQEYANKKGIDAKVKSMTQAEKTLLRYQYVMDNTGAAQGDFARTANTWANQVRILNENLRELAKVIGKTFTNALKPMVSALNAAMSYIIAFAETVSNALGKIFGWKYEAGGGGVTNDLETGAGAADDIASGMSDAADSAKKLKDYTLGIDELNVLSPDDSSSSSGGSGSGDSSFGGVSADGGQWVKDESLLDYESSLNKLRELGEYVGQSLTNALNSIPWDSVYEKARNFGTGLAEFLNGLISPELFGTVGSTIAGALNTAVYAALSFGQEFDFYNFGVSLATGINDFFATFDFASLAETINVWVQGLYGALLTAIGSINWLDVYDGIIEFLENLNIETVAIIIGAVSVKRIVRAVLGNGIIAWISSKLSGLLTNIPITLSNIKILADGGLTEGTGFVAKLADSLALAAGGASTLHEALTLAFGTVATVTAGIMTTVGGALLAVINFFSMWKDGFSWIKEALMVVGTALVAVGAVILGAPALVAGVVAGIIAAVSTIAIVVHDNWDSICEWLSEIPEWFDMNLLQPVQEEFDRATNAISILFSTAWQTIQDVWIAVSTWFNSAVITPIINFFTNLKAKVSQTFTTLWDSIKKVWNTVSTWFNNTVITPVATFFANLKINVSNIFTTLWEDIKTVWNTVSAWFTDTVIAPVQTAFETATTTIGNVFTDLWNGIKTGVLSAMNAVIAVVEGAVNGIIDMLNTLHWEIPEWVPAIGGSSFGFNISHISLPKLEIPKYEIGGFPEDGLFMANHTELVGQFNNGKTAVANNDQIISGIQRGVYEANSEQNGLMQEMIELLKDIRAKDTTIKMGSREVGKSLSAASRRSGYKLGTAY